MGLYVNYAPHCIYRFDLKRVARFMKTPNALDKMAWKARIPAHAVLPVVRAAFPQAWLIIIEHQHKKYKLTEVSPNISFASPPSPEVRLGGCMGVGNGLGYVVYGIPIKTHPSHTPKCIGAWPC